MENLKAALETLLRAGYSIGINPDPDYSKVLISTRKGAAFQRLQVYGGAERIISTLEYLAKQAKKDAP